jgi:hypothetical protein
VYDDEEELMHLHTPYQYASKWCCVGLAAAAVQWHSRAAAAAGHAPARATYCGEQSCHRIAMLLCWPCITLVCSGILGLLLPLGMPLHEPLIAVSRVLGFGGTSTLNLNLTLNATGLLCLCAAATGRAPA